MLKLLIVCFFCVLLYSCKENNINGHWHIIETTETEDVDDIALNFFTFDIDHHQGNVNQASIFLPQSDILINKGNNEIHISTADSESVHLKYDIGHRTSNAKDDFDTDSLILYYKEGNRTFTGYRAKENICEHSLDPFYSKPHLDIRVPIIPDTIQINTKNKIQNSSFIIITKPSESGYRNRKIHSSVIVDGRIAGSIENLKDAILFKYKNTKQEKVKIYIDNAFNTNEIKEVLHILAETKLENSYIPIKRNVNGDIFWIKASVLLAYILESEVTSTK